MEEREEREEKGEKAGEERSKAFCFFRVMAPREKTLEVELRRS